MRFPLFNTLRHTRLCMAALTLGLGIHLPSQAQDGTLVAAGQISNSTCVFKMDSFGIDTPITGASSRSLALGSVNRSNLQSGNGTFGPLVGAIFSLGAPGTGLTPCGSPGYDFSIQLRPEQIATISGTGRGTDTFIKNSLSTAEGGTDAVVILRGGNSNVLPSSTNINNTTPLNLKANIGLTGNYISGLTTRHTVVEFHLLAAQFVGSSTTNPPSPGRFVQTIQLLAVYN